MSASPIELSFYDHHRQSYGHMPIRVDNAEAEFMVGDYGQPGDDNGVGVGGEFAIYLVNLQGGSWSQAYMAPYLRVFHDATGSLRAFLDSGAWDLICKTAKQKEIRSHADLTALLVGGGLHDRSDHPVGHRPACACCGPPVEAASR